MFSLASKSIFIGPHSMEDRWPVLATYSSTIVVFRLETSRQCDALHQEGLGVGSR